MGLPLGGVWVMYYYRVMGYDMHFPVNQLGGPKKVWTIREYVTIVGTDQMLLEQQ